MCPAIPRKYNCCSRRRSPNKKTFRKKISNSGYKTHRLCVDLIYCYLHVMLLFSTKYYLLNDKTDLNSNQKHACLELFIASLLLLVKESIVIGLLIELDSM